MNVRIPKLELINSTCQLGKGGVKLISNGSSASIRLSDGVTLAPLSVGTPTSSQHAGTKNYIDGISIPLYDSSGSQQSNIKVISLSTTTNSSGAWTVTLPNIGQTAIMNCMSSAITPSGNSAPNYYMSHITTQSATTISGIVSMGLTIVTLLIGGSNTLKLAPAGVTVNVVVWVK